MLQQMIGVENGLTFNSFPSVMSFEINANTISNGCSEKAFENYNCL